MDLKDIRMNVNTLTSGRWVELDKETAILVARMDNPAYRKKMAELLAPHVGLGKKVAESVADEVVAEVMAETILVGWRGLKMEGVEIPYSKAEAKKLLLDPRLVAFREFVERQSADLRNFLENEEAEVLGN